MLEVGSVAPAFTLPDKDGNSVSLSDFAGKKVVLYFYPKDSTPGCTRQAQAFRDAFEQFAAEGAVIVGISKDSVKSHFNFAAKQELPFILLSDTEKEVLQAYEVWQEKKLYGKVSMGVVRSVYVIDEAGKIAAAWTKVKPEQSAADALAFVCSCNK
ncbi:MAG: thioredoxin-dependent thiol peroxidase [Phascolarctobacterium sp.]|uniref:thioredoxin-dependent thiol peroxidase n=1 Tax=Phascolarctobacterium sp. TaxID=2049039 RepID=UPI0026DD01EB|nr:thioredoxin-dependent thiol peroxidase [Phascolarctobacterium sp.]MDO4922319.1 thioredoxin-dependent thiol peroxidase [Phascolarctobacterium sp.]